MTEDKKKEVLELIADTVSKIEETENIILGVYITFAECDPDDDVYEWDGLDFEYNSHLHVGHHNR